MFCCCFGRRYSLSISLFLELEMELSYSVSCPGSIGEDDVPLDLEVRDELTPPSSFDFFRLVFLGMSGRSLAGESEPPPDPGRLCRLVFVPSDDSLCRLVLLAFFGELLPPLPFSDDE